jgi:hypothetical protein
VKLHPPRIDRRALGAPRRALLCLAVAAAAFAAPARAQDDPWGAGAQWATAKAGYAKAAGKSAADGNVGFGLAYSRFFVDQISLGMAVHYEVLGRYSGPAEVEIPVTAEVAYHLKMARDAKPYFGLGWGLFFHRYMNTPEDESETRPGFFATTGVNALLDEHSLIGVDARLVVQGGAMTENPVFPFDDTRNIHWSVKVAYTRVL